MLRIYGCPTYLYEQFLIDFLLKDVKFPSTFDKIVNTRFTMTTGRMHTKPPTPQSGIGQRSLVARADRSTRRLQRETLAGTVIAGATILALGALR